MDIVAKLQGQLECPICFSISQLRIFVCENGHKICEPCHGRLAAPGLCPQSRLELETKAIRRFAKISIVSYNRPSLMIIVSASQFHVYLPWGQRPFSIVS